MAPRGCVPISALTAIGIPIKGSNPGVTVYASATHTFVPPPRWDSPTHSWFTYYAVGMALLYPFGTPLFYLYLLRSNKKAIDRLRVNQALRVQLIEKHAAEDDYASSQVSRSSRFVPWVISKKVTAAPFDPVAQSCILPLD